MKKQLKALAQYLAGTRLVRKFVGNLIYPAVAEYLRDEVRPDVVSHLGWLKRLPGRHIRISYLTRSCVQPARIAHLTGCDVIGRHAGE